MYVLLICNFDNLKYFFQVVNSLGAGKGKHKIQCTYYTTLDITPALRSKVKSIQLVSLVLSKDWKQYGNLACNSNLLEDLKDLEENGLKIYKPVEKIVKAGLALIVGGQTFMPRSTPY